MKETNHHAVFQMFRTKGKSPLSNSDSGIIVVSFVNVATFIDSYRLVMIIALSVIVSCFVLTVLVVICCFCPHCLMYDACRAKYTRGEIIAYSKYSRLCQNCPQLMLVLKISFNAGSGLILFLFHICPSAKEEEMVLNSTMPYEDQTEKSSYSTQAIKIKPIADV